MADCTIVGNEVPSNAEGTGSGNKPLEIATNALGPGKVSNMNGDLLICNVVANTETSQEKQDSLLGVEIDVLKHSQLEALQLDCDSLICDKIASVQNLHDTQEPPIDMESNVIQLDGSKLNNDLLSCNENERFIKPSSPNGAEVDALQHSQREVSNLNGDSLSCNDNAGIQTPHDKLDVEIDVTQSALDKTCISQSENFNIGDIGCNDNSSIQTPHDKLDAEIDVSQAALDKTYSSQSEDYEISDIVCNDNADILNSHDKLDAKIDVTQSALDKTCISQSEDFNIGDIGCKDNSSIQTPHDKLDAEIDVSQAALDKTYSSQSEDYEISDIVCNDNADLLNSHDELDAKIDVTQSALDKTCISQSEDYNIGDIVCNDNSSIQTPHEKLDAEIDVSQAALDKTYSSQSEDYKISDIVWAKIGKYPFWPSVVCVDPKSNTYIKTYKTNKIGLHVRFCNDKGRRSWTSYFEKYCGKSDLLAKYPNCLSYIKNNEKLMNVWNVAVEEAENLKKLDEESRMLEFFKTYLDSDQLNCLTSSGLNSSSLDTATVSKVRAYSRKRPLPHSDQGKRSKLMKTDNSSVACCSSGSIDTSLLSKSDDVDSTVSDVSMDDVFVKSRVTKKKKRSTKTCPPKNQYTDKFYTSDFFKNYTENDDESDNSIILEEKSSIQTRWLPKTRKLEILTNEQRYKNKSSKNSSDSGHSSTKIMKSTKSVNEMNSNNDNQQPNTTLYSQSPSSSKKTAGKKTPHDKESSVGRKSITVKNESSPEPDTTESETSSKNETYDSIFLASTENKQLFVKCTKKACVVCKNNKHTVKCSGPCQSYFHKDCLDKSEERYSKPVNKIISKGKKQCIKPTHKNYDSIISSSKIEPNVLEECATKSDQCDNFLCSPLNGMSSISKVENENNGLISLQNANNGSVTEMSKKEIVDPSVKNENMTVEKVFKDDKHNMCSLCKANKTHCYVCGLNIEDPEQKIVCKLSNCGKYFHQKCLEEWPQCQWVQGSRNNVRCIICPHHVCHLCISDNPKNSCTTYLPTEKLIRCIKCPTAYHRSEYCLPAGSQVLSYCDIICSRHFQPSKNQSYHYNASWCFICTLGGTLICCDLCPSSFHIKCLNQNPSEFEGSFTCEECQTGRYPLYGEIVWAKVGNYRWWPAKIVFPNQVPAKVNALPHSVGQFAVKFFGTYNYYWVNRGKVFNFHEGDDENILTKGTMKVIEHVYQDAVIEAAQSHNAYILEKDKHDAIKSKQSLTKPPKYRRIKFNRPYGNVKNMELATTPMTACECDPFTPNPCGPGSDCINRMLMFECQPQLCSAGEKCNNQRFEKVLYPQMEPFLTTGRGWGLKTLEDIKEGSFVIEYVGEVIDEEEFQRRCFEMQKRNEQNYYFFTIDNYRTIDAGPKGNLSRFMNHSCEPNCVTQKWTVNGDTRIGLFALHDIQAGTELVFDYRLESCSGFNKKPCQCGAARCSKFIGVKVEEEKKNIISTIDADKSETSTKNKRKPLKIKGNVSDLDKSKLSKEIHNSQDISKPAIEVDESKTIKTEIDCNKSKTKTSNISSSAVSNIKEEINTSETLAITKSKQKSSARHTTDLIKDGTSVKNGNIRNKKGTFVCLKKMYLAKTKSLSLSTKSKKVTTSLPSAKTKGRVIGKINVKDSKSTQISENSPKIPVKTEQIHEVILNNASTIKPEVSLTLGSSRHSLSRLAKSRHSILSKSNSIKCDTIKKSEIQIVEPEKMFIQNKDIIAKSNSIKCDTIKKPANQIVEPENMFIQNKEIIVKGEKTNKKHKKIPPTKTVTVKQSRLNKWKQKIYHSKHHSCSVCGEGLTELTCKNKKCLRVFHLSCVNKNKISKSGFICPSHFCSVCKKRKVVAKCKCCVESFCSSHVKENIFKDPFGQGMLCTVHYSNEKLLTVPSTLVTPVDNVSSKNIEPGDSADPRLGSTISKALSDNHHLKVNTEKIDYKDFSLTQFIEDECDRKYIQIGGFNVSHMSNVVADPGKEYSVSVNTDGDLFKPSLANVVIDIESVSALYQSTDSLQLVSIATENKYCDNYVNIQFIPDVGQTSNKWLATEP